MTPARTRLIGSIGIVAAPLAVAVVGSRLMQKFLPPDMSSEAPAWQAAAVAGLEASARLWAGTTFLVLIVAAVAAVIAATAIMRLHLERVLLGVAIAATVAVLAMLTVGWSDFDLLLYLGPKLFEGTLGSYPRPGTGLGFLRDLIHYGNIAGIAAAAFVAVAVAALAPRTLPDVAGLPKERMPEVLDPAVRELAARIRDIKYLLLAAAGVLLTAVVHMKAWRDWPLAFFGEKDAARQSYEALAGATITYDAFYFVLILAAMFLPMAWWLRNAGNRLAALHPGAGGDASAQDKWSAANGLSLPINEQAQRFIAIVSPFLGVPALELLKKLASL